MEDLPRNVSCSNPGIKISDFPLDVLYNAKMEKRRMLFTDKFRKCFPIEVVVMKSESTEVEKKDDISAMVKMKREFSK